MAATSKKRPRTTSFLPFVNTGAEILATGAASAGVVVEKDVIADLDSRRCSPSICGGGFAGTGTGDAGADSVFATSVGRGGSGTGLLGGNGAAFGGAFAATCGETFGGGLCGAAAGLMGDNGAAFAGADGAGRNSWGGGLGGAGTGRLGGTGGASGEIDAAGRAGSCSFGGGGLAGAGLARLPARDRREGFDVLAGGGSTDFGGMTGGVALRAGSGFALNAFSTSAMSDSDRNGFAIVATTFSKAAAVWAISGTWPDIIKTGTRAVRSFC